MMAATEQDVVVAGLELEIVEVMEEDADIVYKARDVVKGGAKSLVWKFFSFKGAAHASGPDKSKVYCSLCESKNIKTGISYCGGTTNLSAHLKSRHKAEYDKSEEEASRKESTKKGSNNNITNYFSGPNTRKVYKWSKSSKLWTEKTVALAKWFCHDSRPSFMVEDEGFKKFMELACPEYDLPTADTIGNYIKKLFEEEKERVKAELKVVDYVSLTTDGGSSTNAVSFQDTNAHFLTENLELKSVCLSVKENREEHTAVNYRANTDEVTDEFDIKEKVVMTVTDNENKMRAAYKDHERSGCLAHILHSSVTKGIAETEEVDEIVKKVRRIATKFNNSYKLKYKVEEEQKRRGLPVRPILQDVATRWGSTRYSTESFLDKKSKKSEDDVTAVGEEEEVDQDDDGGKFENMEVINEALGQIKYKKNQKKSDYVLTRTHMKRIKSLNNFLTVLDIYSTTLGGDTFVTSSIVFPVVASLKKLLAASSEDPVFIARMKATILEDFTARSSKNLNFPFLLAASALDCRFKSLKVIESKAGRERVYNKIEEEMRDMLDEMSRPIEKESLNDEIVKKKKRKLCLDFDVSDEEEDEEEEDQVKNELDQYRKEKVLDHDMYPLDWWRARKDKYPILIRLVRYRLFVYEYYFLFQLFSESICAVQQPPHRRRGSSQPWPFC